MKWQKSKLSTKKTNNERKRDRDELEKVANKKKKNEDGETETTRFVR